MKAAVLLLTLLASAAALIAPAARACRYCQQAADPVEVMRFQGQGRNAGSFPLDDALNSYGNNRTPAAPAVVTTAAELPARPVAAPAPVAVAKTPPAPPAVVQAPPTPAASIRWADLGLVALAAAGGWFAWRTRAATA